MGGAERKAEGEGKYITRGKGKASLRSDATSKANLSGSGRIVDADLS
jgi:hypothetical protein